MTVGGDLWNLWNVCNMWGKKAKMAPHIASSIQHSGSETFLLFFLFITICLFIHVHPPAAPAGPTGLTNSPAPNYTHTKTQQISVAETLFCLINDLNNSVLNFKIRVWLFLRQSINESAYCDFITGPKFRPNEQNQIFFVKLNPLIMSLSRKHNRNQIWPPGEIMNKQRNSQKYTLTSFHRAREVWLISRIHSSWIFIPLCSEHVNVLRRSRNVCAQ